MAWLFERTVEMAAWVAMAVAWIAAGLAIYFIVGWFGMTGDAEAAWQLLRNSAISAGACVGFAVSLGALACVDRFLFDRNEP